MVNEVISLFNEGKLLVRAMDTASLTKYDGDWRLDFTSWANEYEFSKISLLFGESIIFSVKTDK